MLPALFVLLPILFLDTVVVLMAVSAWRHHRAARNAQPHA
jgi:hypothetical protein